MAQLSRQAQPHLQHVSLYPLISDEYQHHLTTSSAQTLVAVSHSIEEVVMQHYLKGTFYAGFQRVSSFIPQINQYARLAAICGWVIPLI